ncbi:MAG TPA: hypothetical protein VHA10_09290, partial [Hypericibacter adhaerens]
MSRSKPSGVRVSINESLDGDESGGVWVSLGDPPLPDETAPRAGVMTFVKDPGPPPADELERTRRLEGWLGNALVNIRGMAENDERMHMPRMTPASADALRARNAARIEALEQAIAGTRK